MRAVVYEGAEKVPSRKHWQDAHTEGPPTS